MSEGAKGHEKKPKSDNPPSPSTGPLPFLPQGSESVESSPQTESPVAQSLEPPAIEIFEDDQTLATLLRAVESTNLGLQQRSSDAADPKSAPAFLPKTSESVVPSAQTESSVGHPEPAPIEVFKNDETLARLLRAVERSNLALQSQSSKLEDESDPKSARAWLEEGSAGALTFADLIASRLSSAANPAAAPPSAPPRAARATAAKRRGPVRVEPPTSNATAPAPAHSAPIPPSAQSPQAAKPPMPESSTSEHVEPQVLSTPQHPIPLFSVSSKHQQYDRGEDHPSSISPASFSASDSIDSALDISPFKPPAPAKGLRPFFARLNKQLRQVSSKIGVPATFHDRLDQLISWLCNEPFEKESLDPRRKPRLYNPPLTALFWTGGPLYPHRVSDISSSGLYLLTRTRWSPGTRLSMALRRTDRAFESPGSWLIADYLVVRRGPDGFGGVFIPYRPGTILKVASTAEGTCATKLDLQRFVNNLITG